LNGTLDPKFNSRGTRGLVVTGIGSGSTGQIVAPMSNGELLVGGSYSDMDCGVISIGEYRWSGDVDPRFKPIALSGTSTVCSAKAIVPGLESAQLANLLPLPRGEFDAVGYAFTPPASQPFTPSLGRAAAFVVRFHSDGSIDRSYGRNGFVLLPGLVTPVTPYSVFMPQTTVGAVSQPSGGVIVAIVKNTGVFLDYITAAGRVSRQVHLPTTATLSPGIAVGDAGHGKTQIIAFSSTQWSVERYLEVGG
jgi:hypothetical protein